MGFSRLGQSQLELWLDVLAIATGQGWTEGWDSFAAHNLPSTGTTDE